MRKHDKDFIYSKKINDALDQVSEYYGDRCAKRSGVPLMNHIYEGLEILDKIGSGDTQKAAFALHPLGQNEINFTADFATTKLVEMYVEVANSYLCRPETDNLKDCQLPHLISKDICNMLLADKLQNYQDFTRYHLGKHERSDELEKYFQRWIMYLYTEQAKLPELWSE